MVLPPPFQLVPPPPLPEMLGAPMGPLHTYKLAILNFTMYLYYFPFPHKQR